MIVRLLSMLLVGAVLLAGLVGADEPAPGKDDGPPLRLKRKKRSDPPPARQEDKKDKEKEKTPPEKAKEDEPLIPEDGEPGEMEDEKEVLERIARNMRGVEEKLGNRELGEPTSQQQRDILRDLDSLIKRSEQQQSGNGGANQQPQGGDQDRQSARQRGSRGQRSMARSGRPRRQPRNSGRGQARERGKNSSGRAMAGMQQRPGMGTQGGMNPGAGGTSPTSLREINTEMYKDIWGHLPESLRAEMNAYSNPQPFLPRYDQLIREYYKTIAEQGRKKGE